MNKPNKTMNKPINKTMNIYLKPDNFLIENIQFLETKPNIVMNGVFTKIIYSDYNLTLNGIYILFPIQVYSSQKNIIHFYLEHEHIEKITTLEQNILQYYKDVYYKTNYTNTFSIKKQLQQKCLRLSSSQREPLQISKNCKFILKISGIWENDLTVGLTYKFLQGEINE
jgi:hypothetical protein